MDSNSSARPILITGNWKMHKTIEQSLAFVMSLAPLIKGSQVSVALAPPFTALFATSVLVSQMEAQIQIGGQNMHEAASGAYTGEISAEMLKEAGASFVILGHSERRHLFHETNQEINRKVKSALDANLTPILCVGESLEQKEEMESVLKEQLLASLEGLSAEQMAHVVVAYEPVWAIGTGQVAEPADAQRAHRYLRDLVASQWGDAVAAALLIQYGGSVKPENATELLKTEGVDGLLIGGASLQVDLFSEIIKNYQR